MLIPNNMTGLNRVQNSQQGFTLIELLMTISIMAVISMIAVPSISQSLAKQRIKNGAVLLRASLKEAKSESMLMRKPVRVTYKAGDSGSNVSPSLVVESLTYEGKEIASTTLISSHKFNQNTDIRVTPSSATTVIFRPSKRIEINKNTGQSMVYTICDSSVDNENPMQVQLSAVANVTMTKSGSCL